MPRSSSSFVASTSHVRCSCSAASSLAFSPSVCGVSSFGRHVREVARSVRPVGDDRRALDSCLELADRRRGRSRSARARASRSRPSSGPASTRRGSSPRPAPRPAPAEARGGTRRAARRAFRRRGRARAPRPRQPCAERPRRRRRGFSDAGRDETRRVELAVEVEQDRLAALASQVAALAKLPEQAAELLVEDRRPSPPGLLERRGAQARPRPPAPEGRSRPSSRLAMVSLPQRRRGIDSPDRRRDPEKER